MQSILFFLLLRFATQVVCTKLDEDLYCIRLHSPEKKYFFTEGGQLATSCVAWRLFTHNSLLETFLLSNTSTPGQYLDDRLQSTPFAAEWSWNGCLYHVSSQQFVHFDGQFFSLVRTNCTRLQFVRVADETQAPALQPFSAQFTAMIDLNMATVFGALSNAIAKDVEASVLREVDSAHLPLAAQAVTTNQRVDVTVIVFDAWMDIAFLLIQISGFSPHPRDVEAFLITQWINGNVSLGQTATVARSTSLDPVWVRGGYASNCDRELWPRSAIGPTPIIGRNWEAYCESLFQRQSNAVSCDNDESSLGVVAVRHRSQECSKRGFAQTRTSESNSPSPLVFVGAAAAFLLLCVMLIAVIACVCRKWRRRKDLDEASSL